METSNVNEIHPVVAIGKETFEGEVGGTTKIHHADSILGALSKSGWRSNLFKQGATSDTK